MNKKNTVINKIICTGLALAIVLSVFDFGPAMAQNNRYLALEKVVAKNPDLDLFINEKSQTIDLARTQNIRVRIKAKDLYNSIDRTASFKISVYENKGSERKFISSQQLSIFKGFKRSRVLSISAGEFTSPTKNLEFDIYDTAGNIINTYKTTISAINIESQVSGSTGINIAEANCDGETFGECQIDYLLQRVQFEAKPQRQASTRVVKTNDGLYKVTFPFPRNKFKFLGRKVRRKTKDNIGGGDPTNNNGGDIGDFGETLNISTINFGDSLAESQFITYGPDGDLIFNDNLFLDLQGKLGIGVQTPLAWLHVKNGSSLYPSIKIGRGPLTTVPVDGALEFDGTNLYFTVGTTRNVLGAGSGGGTIINNNTNVTNNNTTEIFNNGNITYNNGTIINFLNGSYMEDPIFNGFVLFSDNSYTQINGQLAIPGGTQFQVLTYINGLAMWRNSSSVFNGAVSINQTFNIDNGTYFIDNGTYFETDNVYNIDNGTYNFFNSSVLVDNGYYDYTDTYISHLNSSTIYNNSDITYNNGTIISFTNGSYMQDAYLNGTTTIDGTLNILGGTQFHVLTYINGSALWRAPSGDNGTYTFNNGSTTYFNQNIAFTDNIHNYFDTTINTTNNIENHSNLDVTYVDVFEQYFNGVSNYFNQSITFNDNIHNYFDTAINTTNNIENHSNLDVTYVDVFEQYFNGVSNYFNQTLLYEDSLVNFSNTDVLFTNGTRLIIPGGINGQVLTYVNGVALWRDTSAIANGGTINYSNGISNYFNQDIFYTNLSLEYNNVIENFYDSTANYYNQTELYYNGDSSYFNQSITFTDNIHNYFDTTINTTNNIENHSNLDVTYVDVFEQYFNGVSNYYNQTLLYEDSLVNFSNTDVIFSNGASLIIPGGVNGQVLTFVNGETLWRPSSGGTTEWTDIGSVLHPADLGGEESIVIGGTSIALADIYLSRNGGAMFNKQSGTEDFVMLNAAGQEFRIEGANGNVAIRTAGLIGESTLELSDTTQAVTFSMLPNGAGTGPMFIANTLGLTIDGSSSLTVNVDGAGRELFVNGNTISVGPTQGNATFNVDGNFALIGTANQLVTALGGITANRSFVRVAGNGGAITITANPQISVSGTLQDGQILILKGTSDVNTVTIVEGNGVSLESGVNFTLGSKDVLHLIYDSVDTEWIEISRSDK